MDIRNSSEGLSDRTVAPVQMGVVTAVIPDAESLFLDVDLQPSGFAIRCRVTPQFAGAGFGFYTPVREGDIAVVLITDNDPNGNPVCVAVVHANGSALPQDVLDAPDDIWLLSRSGTNINVTAQGSGNVTIKATNVKVDADSIELGGRAARALLAEPTVDFLLTHVHEVVGSTTMIPTDAPDPESLISEKVVLS